MRHNRAVNHLGRKSAHRKAMLSNMACSLIMHKRITTTVAKAKALKSYAEPLVTKSKEDTTHSRRIVFSYLRDKYATAELFRTIAPKIADRPGGYLRVLHLGFRQGDGAEMALVEFVDFNEAALASAPAKKEAKRTTRRSRAKKTDAPKEAQTQPEEKAAAEVSEAAPEEAAAAPEPKEVQAQPEETAPAEKAPEAPAAEPTLFAEEAPETESSSSGEPKTASPDKAEPEKP